MRASRLIEELYKMIDIYGDLHVVCEDEYHISGIKDADNVQIVGYKEGKYFLIE